MKRCALKDTQVPLFLSGATELRVVVKPQPELQPSGRWWWDYRGMVGAYPDEQFMREALEEHIPYPVGSLVALTEAWRVGAWRCQRTDEECGHVALDYKADNYCRREWLPVADPERFEQYAEQSVRDAIKAGYKLDSHSYHFHWAAGESPCHWRSPATMPAEFSRFIRRVAGVRAERLQDITYDGILASGWDAKSSKPLTDRAAGEDAREWYIAMWNATHTDYPWESNPWTWVLTLEAE